MIQPCGGTGMKAEVVGRQKNWFNTCTTSAVPPRARYRCFTSTQVSRNHAETSRSLKNARNRDFECNALISTVRNIRAAKDARKRMAATTIAAAHTPLWLASEWEC